jgi:hypothetical protein
MRKCVQPRCRRPLGPDEHTLHCAECHRTDPVLIRLKRIYDVRMAKRHGKPVPEAQ